MINPQKENDLKAADHLDRNLDALLSRRVRPPDPSAAMIRLAIVSVTALSLLVLLLLDYESWRFWLLAGSGVSIAVLVLHYLILLLYGQYRASEASREQAGRQQKHSAQSIYLSGAFAHEMKPLVSSIRTFSGALARQQQSGPQRAAQAQSMDGQLKHLESMLEDLAILARPMSSLVTREIHPAAQLAESVMHVQELAQGSEVTLSAVPGDAGPIACDQQKVGLALKYLLRRALEDSPAGGTISTFTSYVREGGVKFIIEDEGSGSQSEVPGQMVAPGTITVASGKWLRLAIARAITEQHGGSLVLEERLEGGCKTVMSLPAQPGWRSPLLGAVAQTDRRYDNKRLSTPKKEYCPITSTVLCETRGTPRP